MAEWCGPCKRWRRRSRKWRGTSKARSTSSSHVDEHPGLRERFGVRGIPTLVLMKGPTRRGA
ncbi:thioredoxin domain-containing protein [Burkholderia glumae]|uniref:thioredoxin domain-containing protein n=1 Tax=Burkholderia glumae TaxID=337 RepID=UPI000B4DFF70|nr:hypothetical protein CEQ24_030450 [Burkholderia glumae]